MQTIQMGPSPWRHALYAYMSGHANPSPWLSLALAPLWIASYLYGAASAGRHASYTYGLQHPKRLPCKVISIGNLTLGGTGKTQLTIWMARWFHQHGWRVAVLSRGYGARHEGPIQLVSTGQGPTVDWRNAGDEAYLLAQRLSGVPILTGKDRYRSGLYAYHQFGSQVVILDDGFQYYALHRDLDLVLIDASNPFGHGALFPRGTLREPLRAMRRADAIIVTRAENPSASLDVLQRRIRRWHDTQSIYTMTTSVEGLQQAKADHCKAPPRLRGHRVIAFSAIGNPQALSTTLHQLGCNVVAVAVFPDHHPYTTKDWHAIVKLAHQHRADCLITTEKDAVRLDPDWQAPMPVYVLRIGVRFTPDNTSPQQLLQTLMATDAS
ncbi:MAG: tetraacyldisaccharide 4'-kinase [bacterium]|nr:tetraacyldisaccharide 4'-kinase [bacterium]